MDALTQDQVSLVLRRAAELDRGCVPAPLNLDADAVEQAAVEAGLSRDSVRQALAELWAGALADGPGGIAVFGARTATVCRFLPGPTGEVEAGLHAFLRTELFEPRRDLGSSSEWTRRRSLAAKVHTTVDRAISRKLFLTDLERVTLRLVDEPGSDGERVLVQMVLDVSPMVRGHAALSIVGAVAGSAVVGVSAAVAGLDPVLLATVPAALAVGGGAHYGAARIYRSRVAEVVSAVEGLFDRLERRR
ncbi:MAG: hypothetical protein ACRD1K_08955 [Acidimicrobiales bacterium]